MKRLDKIISVAFNISSAQAKKVIKTGEITVNGIRAVNSAQKAQPEDVAFRGKPINYKEHIYIMLNKPQGVVSASTDKNEKTVVDLVDKSLFRDGLFPAGRLDKDSTGFVLITDDGIFAHNLLSPKKHIQKTYEVLLDKPIEKRVIQGFSQGVTLCDESECLSADLQALNQEKTLVQVKISQGKYHQIKRMFGVFDIGVTALKRTAMGKTKLDEKLLPGQCRELTDNELLNLLKK